MKARKKIFRIMWITLTVIVVLILGIVLFVNQPRFGSIPRGERLKKVSSSVNYHHGQFWNKHETQQLTSDKSFAASLSGFLFKKNDALRPKSIIPSIKTDLWALNRSEDVLIWFGHSSYLLQVEGMRILVDPTLKGAGSPVSFINRPFAGTQVYSPADIPDIDYLVISHDHWDHLDYSTIKALKSRIGKVICGLGTGQHFERWGFASEQIVEMDWDEDALLGNGFSVFCLPARHFSGRSFEPNKSLWASFLFKTPSRKIYIGGDGGYDTHFAQIGERFDDIDLAILENGQYNQDWIYIHTLPSQIVQAFTDLKAKRLFTVHHSKFALSNHPWDEPLKNIAKFAEKELINLIQPMIGEVVNLNDSIYVLNKWWEGLE